MRRSPGFVEAVVDILEDATVRPLRFRIGGITYRMEADEAIELANRLVDTVEQLREKEPK